MREGYILFALFFFFANIGILQGETIHITSQAQSRRADRRRRGSSQHLLTLLKGTTNLTTTTTASSASTQRGEPSASTLMSRSGTGDSVMSDLTMYDVSNENHFDEDGASDVKVIRKDGWSDSDEESYISDDSSLDSSKFFSVRSPSGDDALHFKTSTGPIRSSSGSSISSADSMDSLDSSDSSVDDALFHDAAGDMNMELTGVALGRVLFENEMKAREPSMMSKLMKQLLMGSLNSAARLALGATTIDRLKDSEVSTHYDVHDMGCKFTAKFAADEDGPYFRVRGGLPFPKVNSNFFDLLKLKVSHAHTDTDRATATDHRGYRVFKFPHPRAPDASQVSGRERSSDAVMSSVFDDILVDAFTTDFPQNNDLKDPLTWVGIYEVTDKGLLCGNTGKDYSIETHGYVDEWIDDLCEDSFGFRLRASETLEERVSRIATFNYPVKTSSNVKCYKKLYADHAGHLYSLSLANCDITPQEPDATKKRVYVALVCSNKYNCYAGKTFSAVYDDDLKPDAALQNNLDLSVKIGYHDKDTKELILGMDARWKASFQMDVKMGIHGGYHDRYGLEMHFTASPGSESTINALTREIMRTLIMADKYKRLRQTLIRMYMGLKFSVDEAQERESRAVEPDVEAHLWATTVNESAGKIDKDQICTAKYNTTPEMIEACWKAYSSCGHGVSLDFWMDPIFTDSSSMKQSEFKTIRETVRKYSSLGIERMMTLASKWSEKVLMDIATGKSSIHLVGNGVHTSLNAFLTGGQATCIANTLSYAWMQKDIEEGAAKKRIASFDVPTYRCDLNAPAEKRCNLVPGKCIIAPHGSASAADLLRDIGIGSGGCHDKSLAECSESSDCRWDMDFDFHVRGTTTADPQLELQYYGPPGITTKIVNGLMKISSSMGMYSTLQSLMTRTARTSLFASIVKFLDLPPERFIFETKYGVLDPEHSTIDKMVKNMLVDKVSSKIDGFIEQWQQLARDNAGSTLGFIRRVTVNDLAAMIGNRPNLKMQTEVILQGVSPSKTPLYAEVLKRYAMFTTELTRLEPHFPTPAELPFDVPIEISVDSEGNVVNDPDTETPDGLSDREINDETDPSLPSMGDIWSDDEKAYAYNDDDDVDDDSVLSAVPSETSKVDSGSAFDRSAPLLPSVKESDSAGDVWQSVPSVGSTSIPSKSSFEIKTSSSKDLPQPKFSTGKFLKAPLSHARTGARSSATSVSSDFTPSSSLRPQGGVSARESTAFQPLSDASTLQRHLSTLERTQAEGKRYFSLLPNMSIKMKITANLLTAFSLGNKLTPFTKKYHYEAEIFSLALSTEGHAIYNTLLGEVNDEVRMRYLMHMATKATNVVPELADYAEPCTFTSGAPIAADKNSLKREAILRFSEHKMRMPLKLMTSQISRLTLEKMFLRIHIVRERDFLNLDPRDKIKGTYVFSILHLIEELLRLDDGVAYKQAKLPNGQKEQRVTILGSFKLIRDDPRENRVNPFSKRDFVGDQGNSFMPSIYVYRILGADVYLSDIQMKKINVDFGAVVKRRPSIKRSMGTDTAQLCMSMKNVYLKAEARVHVSLKPEQVKVVGITTLHDDVAVAAKLASSEVCVEPDRNEGGDFIIHSEITKSSLAVQIIDPFDIRLSSTISAINPQINTMAKDLITWILEQYVFSDYSVRKMYTDDGMERDAPVTDAMVTVCDLLEQLDSNRDVQLPQIELFVSIRELILNKEFATLTPAFSSWLALYLFQAGFKVSNGDSQTDRLLFNAPSDVNRLSYGIFSS